MTDILDIPIGETLKYRTVYDFYKRHNLPARRIKYPGQVWRLSDQLPGEVNGLPSLRGMARITDGVILVVETSEGKLFDCHLSSFNFDSEGNEENKVTKRSAEGSGSGSVSVNKNINNHVKVSLTQLADLLA